MAMQKRKVSTHDSLPSSEHEKVLKRSLHLLQALACRNEPVRQQQDILNSIAKFFSYTSQNDTTAFETEKKLGRMPNY